MPVRHLVNLHPHPRADRPGGGRLVHTGSDSRCRRRGEEGRPVMSGLKVVRERALWRPAVLPALKSIFGVKAAVPEFRQLLPDQAVPVWNSFGLIGQFDVKVELTELELE